MRGEGLVFVLGDSRTGTMSLHRYLEAAGYRSIHYFVKESGVSQPVHEDMAGNWPKVKSFIETAGYTAFSDYPTRSFYKELLETYPDAYFILTTRRDLATWQRSMEGFFSKFSMELNLDHLSKIYEATNRRIREAARDQDRKFLDICIDDDRQKNDVALSEFLDTSVAGGLGRENRTEDYDNRLLSRRVSLYHTESDDPLSYVKGVCEPSKVMLSEFGWLFLINEESSFLDYALGNETWSVDELAAVDRVLETRKSRLAKDGVGYLKFVVPEKPIVYSEFLPRVLSSLPLNPSRPARQMAGLARDDFSYLEDVLVDAKSLGPLYFRGDTHTNWLGAFVVYQHIMQTIQNRFPDLSVPSSLRLADLKAECVPYAGDLYAQMKQEHRNHFEGAWRGVALDKTTEHVVRYFLPEVLRSARRQPTPADYERSLGERETFVFETPDANRPRAVVFRDSTSDFMVDLLAEHFSRSVFVWYKGVVCSDIVERERPDIVLHIMAERFVIRYPMTAAFVNCLDTESEA